MTNKLPRITAADVVKFLEKIGFFLSRQSGSHKIYKNRDGKRTTVLIMQERFYILKP